MADVTPVIIGIVAIVRWPSRIRRRSYTTHATDAPPQMDMRLIESMVCILAQRDKYVKPTRGIRTFAPVPIEMTTDAVILRLANRNT